MKRAFEGPLETLAVCAAAGDADNARVVFDNLRDVQRTPVVYEMMVKMNCRLHRAEDALRLLQQMKRSDMAPTPATFAALIRVYVHPLAMCRAICLRALCRGTHSLCVVAVTIFCVRVARAPRGHVQLSAVRGESTTCARRTQRC